MLLFLMRGASRRSARPEALGSGGKVGNYTAELLAAALFLCSWCGLRLLIPHDTSHGVDAVLAVSGLLVGVATVVHCLRALHAGQRKVRAERIRGRAVRRQMRAAKRRERAQRRA